MKRPRKSTAGQTPACPPLPAGGGLFKQNQGKLWCSILSVLQVVYAPARFCEGGTRCFVGRFSFGRRMVPEAGAFFSGLLTWNIILRETYKRFIMPYLLLRSIVVSPKVG